ncbi:MAG: hypothetical protein QXX12_06195 [Nanopusillaceae archaeon]
MLIWYKCSVDALFLQFCWHILNLMAGTQGKEVFRDGKEKKENHKKEKEEVN